MTNGTGCIETIPMKYLFFSFLFVLLTIKVSANRDVRVVQLASPKVFICKGDTFNLQVVVANTGTDTVHHVPVTVVVSGIIAGFYTGTITDTILPGTSKLLQMNQLTCPTNGIYHFKVYTSLSQDNNTLNDTLEQTSYIANTPTAIQAKSQHACLASTFTMSASTPNGLIYWFASDTTSTLLAIGNQFYTPMLLTNTIYWAEAHSYVNAQLGAPDTAIGNAGGTIFYSDAMVFNVGQGLILDSLAVYPINTGKVIIRLLDAFNNVLQRDTTIITVPGVKQYIHPQFTLAPGLNYKVDALGTTTGLMRNTSGASYPYTIAGVFSIVTNTLNPAYYLYFYDWHLRLAGCAGPKIPVYAFIRNSPPVAAFSIAHNGQLIQFNNQSVEADSSFWKFGDGVSNLLWSPNHVYPHTGTFTATLYVFNDCGMDSLSYTFLVTAGGIGTEAAQPFISLTPNPTQTTLHITLSQSGEYTGFIYDALGSLVKQIRLSSVEQNEVSVADLPKGSYYLKAFQHSNGTSLTAKFVKD